MTNCSMTFGGDASVAANFLEAFVEKDIQWIHFGYRFYCRKTKYWSNWTMVRSIATFLGKEK